MLRMIEELRGGKTREELQRLFQLEARIARVATLARRGRYEEADALAADGPAPSPARLLDLRARIAAQRGKWAQARGFWEEALKADPGNASYQAGLRQIKAANRRQGPGWYYWLLSLMLATIALAVMLLVQRCSADLHPKHPKSPKENPKVEDRREPSPTLIGTDAPGKPPAASPPGESPSPAPAATPSETPPPAAIPTETPKTETPPATTPSPSPSLDQAAPAASAPPEGAPPPTPEAEPSPSM
jgi:hypothetical protein